MWFIQLKVKWNTISNECFINEIPSEVFPNKLIRKSSAEVVFRDEKQLIEPLQDFPYILVNEASKGFVDEHRTKHFTDCERILMQKHSVRALPIAMIDWEYHKKTGKFYIYGNEHKVYFPKYPGDTFRYCSII